MKKATGKLLAVTLSLAMILTGFTFLGGAATVNATDAKSAILSIEIDTASGSGDTQPATGGVYAWFVMGDLDADFTDVTGDDFIIQVKSEGKDWDTCPDATAAFEAGINVDEGVVTATIPDNTDNYSKQWRFFYDAGESVACPAITQEAAAVSEKPALVVSADSETVQADGGVCSWGIWGYPDGTDIVDDISGDDFTIQKDTGEGPVDCDCAEVTFTASDNDDEGTVSFTAPANKGETAVKWSLKYDGDVYTHSGETLQKSDWPEITQAAVPAWPEDCFTYTEDNTTITGLTDKGKAKLKTDSNLVLPDSYNGVEITAIGAGKSGEGTFDYKEGTAQYVPTKVLLPAKLKSIGAFAFPAVITKDENYKNVQTGITEITFPDTLESIGATAFQNAPLTKVELPDSVTTLGNGAFTGNDANLVKIKEVKLSENLTAIPQAAFYTQAIEGPLVIPPKVKTIGNNAFAGCPITLLSMPEGLTSIGINAFQSTDLESVTVPASVTAIGNNAFRFSNTGGGRQGKIKTLTLSEGLQRIGKNAFDGNQLTNVSIPSTVTSLDATAFENNTGTGTDGRVLISVSEAQLNGAGRAGTYSKFIAAGTGHRAVCNGKESLIIAFDTNGRSKKASVATKTNSTIDSSDLAAATSTDKYDTFAGWFTKSEGGDEVKAEDAATTIYEKDTTLYALWVNPLTDAKNALADANTAAEAARAAANTASDSKTAAEEASKNLNANAVDLAKKAEADAKAAAEAAAAAKTAAETAKTKADAAVAYADEQGMTIANKKKATDVQNEAAGAVSTATTAKETADQNYKEAKDAAKEVAEAYAKTVKTVVISSKTVTASTVQNAISAAKGSGQYVDTIILGKNVKKISKGAFKGTSTKTLIVKTKKLKKKSVKGSLKGSKVSKVKVQIGKKTTNKKYIRKYKNFFTKKNAGKKAKVTK